MKRFFRREYALVGIVAVILCGVVFHAPLSVGLGTLWPQFALPVKAWKEVLLVLGLGLLLYEVLRHQLWQEFARDWLLRLVALYVLLHAVLLLPFWQGWQASVSGLLIDLRYVLFFVLVYGTVRLYPRWRRMLVVASTVAAAVSLLFAVLQVTVLPKDILAHIGYDKDTTIAPYLTVDQNDDYIRINGTFRGPNPLGAYAGIVLALLAAAGIRGLPELRQRRRLVLAVLLGIGALVALWYSYSRSAVLAAGAGVAAVVIAGFGRRIPKWLVGSAIAGALACTVALVALWNTPFVHNVILHDDPTTGAAATSNDGHAESLRTGFERMVQQPLGAGIGSTGSASLATDNPIIIENQYFFVAHEVGWLGLAVFLALSVMVVWRLYRRRQDWLALGLCGGGIAMMVIGVLLPVWVDDTVSLVWWGLAGMALGLPLAKTQHKRYAKEEANAPTRRR